MTHFGVPEPALVARLTGLELLQGMIDGSVPQAPMSKTVGFRFVSVDRSRAILAGVPSERHLNPHATIHGGWAATLLDSCMGSAIHTLLEAGEGYTTLEFKISFLRALRPGQEEFTATGTALKRGRRAGFATGEVTDQNGELFAHGTTTCLISR